MIHLQLSPKSFEIFSSWILEIIWSLLILYAIKSAIVPIFKLNFFAKIINSGSLAIVPSSFIISQITPDGSLPANLDISTAASVCPALTKTPPDLAFIGKTCPGETKSESLLNLEIAVEIVRALSFADIPVVTPSFASIETVKAVSWRDLLLEDISFKPSSSTLSSVSVRHIKPLPFLAIKLMASESAFSAGITRSPSFSLSSASTKINILPWDASLIISSIGDI